MPLEQKVESKAISAIDFFSGAFNNAQAQQIKSPNYGSNGIDIQIPDFLRK